MIKKLALFACCISFLTFYPATSQAITCQSGYILYNNACYKKLACKNGGTQQANKCKCKTGWTGTLCQTAATGYVDLGSGVLACAAGYKKSGGKCVSKPADRVGAYSANGKNNKTVKFSNTTDADFYGVTTQDNVDISVNNAYADRRDATAAISIVNKGNGDVYGMSNDESMGTNAYAYKGTANGRISINNTGNGKVYGITQDGNSDGNYYNARAFRGGVAIGNIVIVNKGTGSILGSNNNVYAAGESAASGLINIKNEGKGNVTGASGINASTASSGTSSATIKINNKGDGTVVGSNGHNSYINDNTTGEAHGSIYITNRGNGNVYGSKSFNSYSYSSKTSDPYTSYTAYQVQGIAYGSVSINNEGDGMVVGVNGNIYARNSIGENYGYVSITNVGNGDVYGEDGYSSVVYSYPPNFKITEKGKIYSSIKINNRGNGTVVGSAGGMSRMVSYGNYYTSYSYIAITNAGDGDVYGTKGSNFSSAPEDAVIKIKNTGNGNVHGASGNGGTITINNTGDGNVYGAESSNGGIITINNKGDGNVYGVDYNSNGKITIANNGDGDVYGAEGSNGGIITINNKGNGNIYGAQYSNDGLINIAYNGSGKVYGMLNTDGSTTYNSEEKASRIKINNTGNGTAYGMSADGMVNSKGPNGYIDIINKSVGTVYGMHGSNINSICDWETITTGRSIIKILNLGNGNGYGMDNLNQTTFGSEYNAMKNVKDVSGENNKRSTIEMVNKGSGTVMAMRGRYQAINEDGIKIHNLGSGTAVGMYVTSTAKSEWGNILWHQNNGTIIIDRAAYTYDNGTAKTTDDVTYSASTARGGRAIGVYVTSDAYFRNNGTIKISDASTAYGIYAESGATVENKGTITIDGNNNHANKIKLNGAELFQNGLIQANSVNLNSFGGEVVASATSRFEIKNDISGNLAMNSNVVNKGFAEKYTVKDMVKAADTSGLNLVSQSALFDAALENNSDVVMTMKSFNDVVENHSLAAFLKQNYAAQNNAELFDTLKSQHTAAALNSTLDSLTGNDLFNRFNFEDITMMRELNMEVNNTLFSNKEDNLVTAGSIAPFYFDGKSNADGKYALYNHRSGKKSYGLSFALTSIDSSDHHSNNTRKDETFQMSTPFGYGANGFKFITAPRFGYAYGNYDRDGFAGKTYRGTIEKRMFGLANEVRYPIKLGNWKIAPAAEFNMLGYHLKGNEDAQQYSLKIRSQNNYSVESGLGLYANRELKPTKNSTLRLNAGMAVYHEFADPYSVELGMNEMSGSFKLKDERRKDNRAVIRAGFDYSYGNITLNGNFATFVDGTTHNKAEIDLRYNF